jgi:alkaline phosphatase
MKKFKLHKTAIIFISALLILVSGGSGVSPKPVSVKNVILLIGDGMGLAQVYAAILNSKEKLNIERAQFVGLSKTYSADNDITDSGAGGTALSTGHKTYNGAIGVDTARRAIKNIREYAEDAGKSTGVVVTCNLTHATPAAFLAHETARYFYNKIAMDYSSTNADILIGGGAHIFDSLGVSGRLRQRGFEVTYTLDSVDTETLAPVACFASSEHLPMKMRNRGDFLPNATAMALQKLNLDTDGFFLMVEGSQIDWACHSNNLDYLISEVLDFDKAVGVAMDYADNNPGTLVVVTADHETGGLTWPDNENNQISGHFSSTGHTGIMVPVYAYGTGAEEFSGIMENTQINVKMMKALHFKYE